MSVALSWIWHDLLYYAPTWWVGTWLACRAAVRWSRLHWPEDAREQLDG